MRKLFLVLFLILLCSIGVLGQSNGGANGEVKKLDNCRTLRDSGVKNPGPHRIHLNNVTYTVICDQQLDGGGWTLIQQRQNGQESFWNRLWDDYKHGFGPVGENSSFWVGNELINLLSEQYEKKLTLRIELYGDRSPNSTNKNAFYWSDYFFKLGNESTDYTLQISPKRSTPNGNASGGWYDFTYSDGVKFSTIDRINDPMVECQRDYHLGGWWTNYCGLASLNGEYAPRKFGDGYGLFFTIAGQYVVNPERTRMLLRDRENETD